VIGRNRNPSLSRYDSVLINRLRIGHTRLTNSYLLKPENQPECQICHSSASEVIRHTCAIQIRLLLLLLLLFSSHCQARFIDCICFSAARQRYLGVDTLKELFDNVESQNIVAFIKDTNFYHCI